jgi:hypothetical protein
MASDRSQSSEALLREQIFDANGAQQEINGDTQITSDEGSEGGDHGDMANEEEDGDLFGDEGDEQTYTKPYATVPFN